MRIFKKGITVILMALLAILTAAVPSSAVYADGGTVQVRLDAEDASLQGEAFPFDLYYVGGLSGTRFINTEFPGSGADVSIPVPEEYDPGQYGGMSWQEAWAGACATLAAEISSGMFGDPQEIAMASQEITCGGGAGIFDLDQNGLYLLIGRSRVIGDYLWTPTPCFIGVLNGRVVNQGEIVVKPVREKAVFEHMVIKTWSAPEGQEDLAAELRPSEVLIRISCGGTPVDTVSLNNDNNWTYTWKSDESSVPYKYLVKKDGEYVVSKEFEPAGDGKWTVSEVRAPIEGQESPTKEDLDKLRCFKAEIPLTGKTTEADDIERFTVTNTLSVKSAGIEKTLDRYDPAGKAEFTFRITGTDGSGSEIYEGTAEIRFGPEDGLTKTVPVTGIPGGVTQITVTEDPSEYYEQAGEPEISYDEDAGGWTVKIRNEYIGGEGGKTDTGDPADLRLWILGIAGSGLLLLLTKRRRNDR